MTSIIELVIDWEETDTGDYVIEDADSLLEYVCSQVEGNAQFDHVNLRIKSAQIL